MSATTAHALPQPATSARDVPFRRILCAVDAGRCAAESIAQALTLAGRDAELTFLTVADARGTRNAGRALEHARAAAQAAGVDAAEVVRRGHVPRAAILEEARHHDLLVLGTHGEHRTAGFLLGGTAAAALHRAPVPVLIARPARVGTRFPEDILLATDGSAAMAAVVATTAALARRYHARVALLHVDRRPSPALAQDGAALSAATGVEPLMLQLDGHAPARIAEVALELPASLVVTGSRMLTGIRRLRSVSQRTGLVAPCSVLVMRRG